MSRRSTSTPRARQAGWTQQCPHGPCPVPSSCGPGRSPRTARVCVYAHRCLPAAAQPPKSCLQIGSPGQRCGPADSAGRAPGPSPQGDPSPAPGRPRPPLRWTRLPHLRPSGSSSSFSFTRVVPGVHLLLQGLQLALAVLGTEARSVAPRGDQPLGGPPRRTGPQRQPSGCT